jgi:hypothetical protein
MQHDRTAAYHVVPITFHTRQSENLKKFLGRALLAFAGVKRSHDVASHRVDGYLFRPCDEDDRLEVTSLCGLTSRVLQSRRWCPIRGTENYSSRGLPQGIRNRFILSAAKRPLKAIENTPDSLCVRHDEKQNFPRNHLISWLVWVSRIVQSQKCSRAIDLGPHDELHNSKD